MPTVKLGDVVGRVKEKTDKDTSGYDYYIGGEHFDNGAVVISQRGLIAGSTIGPAFHIAFKKGDVLLMSRNPHLRKAGMVDFDGICSDVSYVCRTKDEFVLKQGLIPFIFQTDEFWKFAEANKKGSTNFFLNWSDFEKYEFNLPSEEEQSKLCTLLWAIERTRASYRELAVQTENMIHAYFLDLFGDPITNPMGWNIKKLLETGSCKNGMNFSSKESGEEINCLGVGDFKDLAIIDSADALPILSLDKLPTEEYFLKDDDIVFVRSNGNKNLVGRCVAVYPGDTPLTYSGFCIRYRCSDSNLLTLYLLYLFKNINVKQKMVGRGANIQNLNQKILRTCLRSRQKKKKEV